MAGNGPVEFFVDIEELGRLRDEIRTLEAELGDLPTQQGAVDGGALGPDVAGAVDRFAAFWAGGRARIVENLGQCGVLAEEAAAAYADAESSIRSAAPAAAVPAGPEPR
jgi:hypothetical protein